MNEPEDNPGASDGGQPGLLTAELAEELAVTAGFARAGVVALPLREAAVEEQRFERWVAAGYAGAMEYMSRRNDEGDLVRGRLERTLAWARAAVVCWAPYEGVGRKGVGLETGATEGESAGVIARYARTGKPGQGGGQAPSDYHKVLLKRLKRLEGALRARVGEFEARAFVDTTPYSERALAVAAGLGWVGKNGCLIVPGLGSYGFLAVLFVGVGVGAAVGGDSAAARGVCAAGAAVGALAPNRCGSCRRCLEACPTGALVEPGVVDARRCIAALTIEQRGPIEVELMERMGDRVFGCDLCQECCPWAAFVGSEAGGGTVGTFADEELAERPELVNPSLAWLGGMTEAEFERAFNGSPVRRTGYAGLRRNVAIAMGASGAGRFAGRLREWAEADDEGLRSAARWALGRVGGRRSGSV